MSQLIHSLVLRFASTFALFHQKAAAMHIDINSEYPVFLAQNIIIKQIVLIKGSFKKYNFYWWSMLTQYNQLLLIYHLYINQILFSMWGKKQINKNKPSTLYFY